MAWCKLEDTVRHHYKFSQLADDLGVRRAEARGLFLSLCSWALVNAPDGLLTGFAQSVIEEGADWQGRRGRLVPALIKAGLLDEVDETTLEIHDFYQRAESRKTAARKRASRDKTVTVTGQDRPSHRGEEKRREEKRGEERSGPTPLAANHPEVLFFEADYRQRFGGPSLSPLERARAAEVIRRCSEAGTPWRDVLDFYARGFEFSGHTLDWLRDHLREVLNKMGRTGPVDDPEPTPWSDEWPQWAERQKAKKR
jgi:hypothetical protein